MACTLAIGVPESVRFLVLKAKFTAVLQILRKIQPRLSTGPSPAVILGGAAGKRTSHSLSLCSGSCSADGSFVDHMFYELHGIVLHTAMAALAFLTQNFILAAQSFQFGGGIFLARRHGRRIDQTIPAAADPANQRR